MNLSEQERRRVIQLIYYMIGQLNDYIVNRRPHYIGVVCVKSILISKPNQMPTDPYLKTLEGGFNRGDQYFVILSNREQYKKQNATVIQRHADRANAIRVAQETLRSIVGQVEDEKTNNHCLTVLHQIKSSLTTLQEKCIDSDTRHGVSHTHFFVQKKRVYKVIDSLYNQVDLAAGKEAAITSYANSLFNSSSKKAPWSTQQLFCDLK